MSAAGLYLHVPYCRFHCPFCSFAVTTDRGSEQAWLDALDREIVLRAPEWRVPFDSVYVGGGTPSLLGAEKLGRILRAVRERFDLLDGAEVTIEANPGTLVDGEFAALRALGVNRLSLGIQSFDESVLKLLGRDHSVEESLWAFDRARREGFENIVVDLIWGVPGRSLLSWRREMDRLDTLRPEHVSSYQLTFEPGTPLERRVARGEIAALSDEEAREHFLATRERLASLGLEQYEVSSYAREPRFRSRHNQKYWDGSAYLGLGPSAHSHRDGVRWWNLAQAKPYIRALEEGGDPVAGREELAITARRLERAFLGLRTTHGLDLERYCSEFGDDLASTRKEFIAQCERDGLVRREGAMLRPTAEGLIVADAIANELLR